MPEFFGRDLIGYNSRDIIISITKHLKVPVIMGVLPLLSHKHAVFLHDKVDGIAVPESLRQEMETAKDPVKAGIDQSKQMLELAKTLFSGACVMPPFDRFEILSRILSKTSQK